MGKCSSGKGRTMKEKIKIVLIATYPTMAEIFLELTKTRADLEAQSINASFERAVDIAKTLERDREADIILSRGGTAAQIRNAVDIPVVSIPITPFDVIRIVHSLEPGTEKIALIHYMKHVPGVQDIARMYGIRIEEYSFLNYLDIEQAVKDAFQKGIRTVIGGEVAVRIAENMGMRGYQVSAGHEAVAHAVEESLALFAERQKERNKARQLKAAYDSLKEGIVVTDEEERIVLINPVADVLFDRKYQIGDKAGLDIINERCRQVYLCGKEEPVYLRKIKKATYAVAHTPITENGRFIGVATRIEDVTRTQELEQKIRKEMHLKGFVARYHFPDIVTRDADMKRLLRLADLYAKTNSAVLIEGESGTGKELLAQSIHNASGREAGPFVAVNCAAIPENLLESELFGYEAGSFTGARKEGKAGLFELAHNGTLFLDEIGEISKSVQTRLLRVLQEKEIMRVGGNRIIPINVRVISATNRNLKELSLEGGFRGDLYYRLNVLHLTLPPLRRRIGDIPLLAEKFLQDYSSRTDRLELVMPVLAAYSWPGNIRELQNAMERLGALMEILDDERMDEAFLRDILGIVPQKKAGNTMQVEIPIGGELSEIVGQVEYEVANRYLEEFDNNQELAAKALGIGRTTFWRKSKGKRDDR